MKQNFDIKIRLLHTKQIDKWLNNPNPCDVISDVITLHKCILFYKLQYQKLKQ
jgi:hypothetical protein